MKWDWLTSPDAKRGQILVLFVLALVGLIGMVALVVEGANAFVQQRISQNGADSSANAGTLVIAESLSGATRSDADVTSAVAGAATANGLQDVVAEYTDDYGQLTGVSVGSSTAIPEGARGVNVTGSREFDTAFARVLGVAELTATAEATAVAGALSQECVEDEDGCALVPVTVPIQVYACDDLGNLDGDFYWVGAPPTGTGTNYYPTLTKNQMTDANLQILPLCRVDPGSVGWLDLTAGVNLSGEILHGPQTAMAIPGWYQTQTGNPNNVESELNTYRDSPILIPLFDGTCRVNPGANVATCPDADKGVDPVGNNTWYHIPAVATFWLKEAFVQGNNAPECSGPNSPWPNPDDSGGGFIGCLKGWFVRYITTGPVVPGGTIDPGVTPVAVQLIK